MERMTHERVNGIKSGYWSAATKESVVQRLAAYENIGLMPGEIEEQLMNFSSFLCEMTGNRMSKTNYTVHDMVSVAEDYWQSFCDDCREEAKQIRERVKAYEDAEAEGRLVVLPCKVGDTVYLLLERLRDGVGEIVESCLVQHSITRRFEFFSCFIDCDEIGNTLEFRRDDFGKTVFLTREEAEAELKGESNG